MPQTRTRSKRIAIAQPPGLAPLPPDPAFTQARLDFAAEVYPDSLEARFRRYDARHPDVPTGGQTYELMYDTRFYPPTKTHVPMKPIPDMRPSHLRRFWARIQKSDTCWLWTGGKTRRGYGTLWIRRQCVYAHRVAYTLLRGEIPAGYTIDHLCGNPSCVNPDHLEPVVLAINIFRSQSPIARNARKTHCIHGHPITEPGQYVLDQGSRRCLLCKREKERRQRQEGKRGHKNQSKSQNRIA